MQTNLLVVVLSHFFNGFSSQIATSRNVRQRKHLNIMAIKGPTLNNGNDLLSSSISMNLTVVNPYDFCPIGRTKKVVHQIPPYGNKLTEVSYMAHSTQLYNGKSSVVWMGSDGAQNTLMAFHIESGHLIREYLLDVELVADWESMTLGPCNSYNATRQCLYLGRMGNNDAHSCTDTTCSKGKSIVSIYKLPEPDVNEVYNGKAIKVITLNINYSSGDFPTNRADCESLFVDHIGDQVGGMPGDLYIITKFPTREYLQRLGKISVKQHERLYLGSSKDIVINSVSKLSINSMEWTDGTMNLQGNLIAIRSYKVIKFFPRTPFQTVADAVGSAACNYTYQTRLQKDQVQYESVSFMSSQRIAEASECLYGLPCTLNVSTYELLFYDASNAANTAANQK